MTDKQPEELDTRTPKEKYDALSIGREDTPWITSGIANIMDTEEGGITIISGLRRKCDAEYFRTTFPNHYFISIIVEDKDTLVQRLVRRDKARDFPRETPDDQKENIAKQCIVSHFVLKKGTPSYLY